MLVLASSAYTVNPNINVEVFIHKVDGLSNDYKTETLRDIQQRLNDELFDAGFGQIPINYYLTSIYDHSIYEAFSKVIQKLVPQLPTLENLLNALCSNSAIEKSFLFDSTSKVYVATDSSPVDMQTYELCSDMIDVVLDMTSIYGYGSRMAMEDVNSFRGGKHGGSHSGDSCVIEMANGITLFYRQLNP